MSDATTIELPESMTIHHIESQFGDLKLSFQSASDSLKIDASKIESIDSSGLQILLALVKFAQSEGKNLSWENPTDTLKSSADKIGLTEKLLLS